MSRNWKCQPVKFEPDGVVVLEPIWILPHPLLVNYRQWLERAFAALEKSASTGVKTSLSAWSNTFHLVQFADENAIRTTNDEFLSEFLKSKFVSAEQRILSQHKVFDAIAKLRLSESPPPKFSPAEATSIVREVALAICLSEAELETLEGLISKLFKRAWRHEHERRANPPKFPLVLMPLRRRAERLVAVSRHTGRLLPDLVDAERVQAEMCFDIVAGYAVAAGKREWVPYHLLVDDPVAVFNFYNPHNEWMPSKKWGRRALRVVEGTDSYYMDCVEKLDLLPEQKKTRNAALQMAMHCARRKAEDAATFAGDAAAEPGWAAFARLACSLGGGATGGPTAEKGLVPLILYQVQLLCEADYMASIVEYRHAIRRCLMDYYNYNEE